MIKNNYRCDGQISLWDYLKSEKLKVEPNDSVCEGCKWRTYKSRYLEVDEYGQTWVYCCPGTACANWRHGTPMNLSIDGQISGELEEKIYCYNRDFLPEIEYLIPILEAEFDCKFQKSIFEGEAEYTTKYKKSEIRITESTYFGSNKRFIGVDFSAPNKSGFGCPEDNLNEIMFSMEIAFKRADEIAEQRKNKKKESEEEYD